jgi:phage shock protein A
MSIFSRLTDIINANLTALLDKAEDPRKMIRLIIQEMEDTLVEVRTESARTLAERKELDRQWRGYEKEAEDWEAKAELAVSRQREDLAKAALLEKRRCEAAATALKAELDALDEVIAKLTDEIAALQEKLDDARARQSAMVMRHQATSNRVRVRTKILEAERQKAMGRFDQFEGKLDALEATIESQDLGRKKSLAEEFESLELEEQLTADLERLRQKIAGKGQDKVSSKGSAKG